MEWSQIAKYALGFLTSFYGIYATLTDFREEKDGKKRLSRKGYFGIALLLITSLMSLLLDIHKDRAESKSRTERAQEESARRDEDLRRIEQILAGLKNVSGKLEGQSGVLEKQIGLATESSVKIDRAQSALERSFGLSLDIAGNLGRQLKLSQSISGGLETATASLKDTAQKTDALLHEATDSFSYLDVTLAFEIDPSVFRDDKGEPIVSKEVLEAYGQHGEGKPLPGSAASDARKQLQRHYSLVRSSVLQNFGGAFMLKKAKPGGAPRAGGRGSLADALFGSDRVANFYITEKGDALKLLTSDGDDEDEDSDAPPGVVCVVTYRLSPNRLSGITKYKDLNGAELEIGLFPGLENMEPLWVLLDVGQMDLATADGFIGLSTQEATAKKGRRVVGRLDDFFGLYGGSVTIPSDFFK